VIAEIKHRSPSAGEILPGAASKIETVASAYRRGGASALSIVIEKDFFGGDPAWLPRAKAAAGLPVLMKDFIVDESQVDFAVSIGADAILLIVAALDQEKLSRLHRRALEQGLAVLVEDAIDSVLVGQIDLRVHLLGRPAKRRRLPPPAFSSCQTFRQDLRGKLAERLPLPLLEVLQILKNRVVEIERRPCHDA